MNDARRKLIREAIAKIPEIITALETARDEETEFYDNMPENMQSGDKGEKASEAASALDDAINSLQEAVEQAESAVSD